MKAIILSLLTFLFLVSCSSQGDLKIINETNHYVYFSIKGIDRTIQPNQSISLSLNTGTDYSIFYRPEKEYKLQIKGETFSLYNTNDIPVDETTITVISKKTKKLYLSPTNAGIKINNYNLIHSLYNITYQRVYPDTIIDGEILTEEILPETTWFDILPLPYASEQDSFAFKFFYETGIGTIVYSDTTTLHIDEQLTIDYY